MESLKFATWIMSVVVLVVSINYVVATEDTGDCKDENGNEYANGDNFESPDGCNRCFCTDGVIGCTEMACLPPQGCNFKGELYIEGQQFNDDCNTCTCGENGAVACTQMGCPVVCEHNGKTYDVGDNFMDECNRCRCTSTGVAVCTKKACLPK